MDELEALLILNHLPFVGSIKGQFLIRNFGSATNVIKAPLSEISSIPGFGPKISNAWENCLHEEKWKEDISLIKQFGVQLIPYYAESYPQRLLEIPDFPLILYVLGTLQKNDSQCIAVIGTRQATLYGLEMAHKISRDLAFAGKTIVSGLARGIDTAAHQGALQGGRTIAVLGSGIASIYPAENRGLAMHIQKNGALISEFPMATTPARYHFPQRNRIVSGMTKGTLLIEAPEKSGAMLTTENAIKQKRSVFALPGRVDNDNFRGNHALIREGKAKLIEDASQILTHYNEPNSHKEPHIEPKLTELPEEEAFLLDFLPQQELSIEEIVAKLQWPVAKLNSLLMRLVLKKVVKEYPGKIYKKL